MERVAALVFTFFRCRRLLPALLLLLAVACGKEEENVNPYDAVNYNPGGSTDSVPDPASITGLHKNIFFPKCANPGCHDGTFEPDFRTVQSTFSTLVYMGVNKRTLDSLKFFSYRVIPGDESNSFLLERLLTTTSDYMPSNGIRLPASDINHIRQWIQQGCPDVNGDLPQKPDLLPNIIGYIAFNTSLVRIDTIRQGGVSYMPFLAPANASFYLPLLALDTADGTSATDPANFTVHEIRWSLDRNNFSGAQVINATWFSPLPYGVWQVLVNTTQWSPGTTVYFRVYMNDGLHALPAEFPRNQTMDFYKTYFAFLVQ
ncbi:MAG: hypothetical protein JNL88_11010 [Bacteroidia bacterium]|nr:hypothetical protein [Bacteroidia bacterium]